MKLIKRSFFQSNRSPSEESSQEESAEPAPLLIKRIQSSIKTRNFSLAIKHALTLQSKYASEFRDVGLVLVGYCRFLMGEFNEAVEAFLSVAQIDKHNESSELSDCKNSSYLIPNVTNETVAITVALAVFLNSVRDARNTARIQFTNSSSSCLKHYLDYDSFESIREIAHEIELCNYGISVAKFRLLLSEEPTICGDWCPMELRLKIYETFFTNQIREYLSCFSNISFKQVIEEFRQADSDMIQNIILQLVGAAAELTDYRVSDDKERIVINHVNALFDVEADLQSLESSINANVGKIRLIQSAMSE